MDWVAPVQEITIAVNGESLTAGRLAPARRSCPSRPALRPIPWIAWKCG